MFLTVAIAEKIDAEQCIQLIKREIYDAISAIERASSGCSDSVSVQSVNL